MSENTGHSHKLAKSNEKTYGKGFNITGFSRFFFFGGGGLEKIHTSYFCSKSCIQDAILEICTHTQSLFRHIGQMWKLNVLLKLKYSETKSKATFTLPIKQVSINRN